MSDLNKAIIQRVMPSYGMLILFSTFTEKGHGGWPNIHISGTRFVEKGGSIFLICNASNTDSPPEGLDWFKDGNLLTKRKRFDMHIHKQLSVSTNTIVSALRIDKAEMADTGTYVCRTSGLLTTRFKVDVLNGIVCLYPYIIPPFSRKRKLKYNIFHT